MGDLSSTFLINFLFLSTKILLYVKKIQKSSHCNQPLILVIFMSKSSNEIHQDLSGFLSNSTVDSFGGALSQLSLKELAESIALLQSQPVLESQKKLKKLFSHFNSQVNLEELSQNLTYTSFIYFLQFIADHQKFQNQLSYILIGLPSSVFSKALSMMNDDYVSLLRNEGGLESLQYQLLLFVHEGERIKQELEKRGEHFLENLPKIVPNEMTVEAYQNLLEELEEMKGEAWEFLERANTALTIAWNTNRIDLVEKLSSIYESMQHLVSLFVGHPSFNTQAATGLYAALEQALSQNFDSSLKDDDPAIEGLTRLSIWHLKDYWKLGLLPSIRKEEELDMDHGKGHKEEKSDHQQQLHAIAQKQLERFGIGTVGDLKRYHLFSKYLLQAYLEKHSQ